MKKSINSKVISYSDLDSQMNVSFLSLARIVEDSTTEFLRINHLSGKELNERYSSIIVVIKNHMIFSNACKLNDEISSFVSCIKKEGVSLTLKTTLKRGDVVILTSYIQLVSISMKERRLTDISKYEGYLSLEEEKEEVNPFTRFTYEENENTYSQPISIKSSDIDYSNHLNNIAYLKNYADLLSNHELVRLNLKEIEINYIKEIKENDKVILRLTKKDKTLFFNTYLDNILVNKARFVLI